MCFHFWEGSSGVASSAGVTLQCHRSSAGNKIPTAKLFRFSRVLHYAPLCTLTYQVLSLWNSKNSDQTQQHSHQLQLEFFQWQPWKNNFVFSEPSKMRWSGFWSFCCFFSSFWWSNKITSVFSMTLECHFTRGCHASQSEKSHFRQMWRMNIFHLAASSQRQICQHWPDAGVRLTQYFTHTHTCARARPRSRFVGHNH